MFYLLFCFSFSTGHAQESESIKVVAVGEAELEKEKVAFSFELAKELSDLEKKQLPEVLEVLVSDFDLYRHLFEVEKKPIITTDAQKYRYHTSVVIAAENNDIFATIKLRDMAQKQDLFHEKRKVWMNNIRSFSHDLSDALYKKITGNDSVFKSRILFVSDRTSTKKSYKKELYIMDFDGERKQRLTYLNSLIISPAISHDTKSAVFSVIDSKWIAKSHGKGVQKVKNINLYELEIATKKTTLISSLDGINSGAIYDTSDENIYLTLSDLKNADIYKMNLKTKVKSRITSHYADDVDPHINKDGTLMTYLSGRAGKAMIYTLDPRGVEKDVKRISFVGQFNAAPRFSPDGSEIVFASWVDNLFDLYKIGSDGRNLVRLTKNFGSNEEAWFSPDGQFIVFTSQKILSKSKAVQNIYIMNREGEILKQITSDYGKTYTPRWSN